MYSCTVWVNRRRPGVPDTAWLGVKLTALRVWPVHGYREKLIVLLRKDERLRVIREKRVHACVELAPDHNKDDFGEDDLKMMSEKVVTNDLVEDLYAKVEDSEVGYRDGGVDVGLESGLQSGLKQGDAYDVSEVVQGS